MRIGAADGTAVPPPSDDLPIFEEAQPRSVAFAPRALRPKGGRWPVGAVAWIVVLAALAGLGLLDGEGADGPAAAVAQWSPDSSTEAPAATSRRLPSTQLGARLLRDVVDLASPAPARVEVTTRSVSVEGAVLVRAARVEIFLEARGNRVIDHASVDVSDPHGGIRPELAPTFSASFELPNPRPNGTMWVVVTAYDDRNLPLGGTRRPFAVGPLVEAEPPVESAPAVDPAS